MYSHVCQYRSSIIHLILFSSSHSALYTFPLAIPVATYHEGEPIEVR